MAVTTTYTSNFSDSIREDLIDVITNIAPDETVALSNFGRASADQTAHEWLTDDYGVAGENAVVEGADADAAAVTPPARLNNRVQTLRKVFGISDRLEAVTKAGRKSELKYQTARHMKMLARDIDYALINNGASQIGDGNTVPDKMAGMYHLITTNVENFGNTNAVTNLLTEEGLIDMCQGCFEHGGKPDLIICTPFQKRNISMFNGSDRLTVNATSTEKKIVNVVDYYECDFGMVKVVPSTNIALAEEASNKYGPMFVVQKDTWKSAWLKGIKSERLARTGLSTKIQISAHLTLEARDEKGSALFTHLYNGPA
jgi:hypothetical protein